MDRLDHGDKVNGAMMVPKGRNRSTYAFLRRSYTRVTGEDDLTVDTGTEDDDKHNSKEFRERFLEHIPVVSGCFEREDCGWESAREGAMHEKDHPRLTMLNAYRYFAHRLGYMTISSSLGREYSSGVVATSVPSIVIDSDLPWVWG